MSFPRYEKYKDSGTEGLGEVPAHWEVTAIKRRCSTITDGAHISPQTENGVVCFVSTKDIGNDSIDFDGCLKTSEDSYNLMVRSGCQPLAGDVLFSKDGTIGRTVVVRESRVFAVASSLIIIRPDASSLNSEFLNYLCQSRHVGGQVERFVKGAGLPRLSIQNLLKVNGVFPPMKEQERIASFLGHETAKIDALVTKQQRLIELLREKRQAVISHVVTKGLDPKEPKKDSGVNWLGKVPVKWDVVRLRYLSDIDTGSFDTVDAIEDGEYPFFVRSETIERLNQYTHDCEAVFTSGDGAGVGKIFHHYRGKFSAHQRVYIFQNFRRVTGAFFHLFMAANFYKVALEGGAKSTVDSLRRPLVANFWMTVPPSDVQAEIVDAATRLSGEYEVLISKTTTAIELLHCRRAALVSAAVTGKIDIRGLVPQSEAVAA